MASCGGVGADYSGAGGKDDNSDQLSRLQRCRQSTWNTFKSITKPRKRERGRLSGAFIGSGTSDDSRNQTNTVDVNPSTANLSTATQSTATPPTFSVMQSAGTSLTTPMGGASEPQSEADEAHRIDDGMQVSIGDNDDPVVGDRVAIGIPQTDGAEDSVEEGADGPVPRGFAGPDEYQDMLREEAQRQASQTVVASSGRAIRRGLAKVKQGLKLRRSDKNREG